MNKNKQLTAERMRSARILSGLTQTEASRRVGIKPQNLSAMEAGRKGAGIGILAALATVYGVTMDYLAGRAPEPPVAPQ